MPLGTLFGMKVVEDTEADMENQQKPRYYARHGMVTRPVHLTPDEAEAIRQAAFAAPLRDGKHISQQQYMREVLTGLRTVPPAGTPIAGN